MKPVKSIPIDRTVEQVQHHYQVEKAIADRLRQSSRSERMQIMTTMYSELFDQVKDHPRLTLRQAKPNGNTVNKGMRPLLQRYLRPWHRVAEFGPGRLPLYL